MWRGEEAWHLLLHKAVPRSQQGTVPSFMVIRYHYGYLSGNRRRQERTIGSGVWTWVPRSYSPRWSADGWLRGMNLGDRAPIDGQERKSMDFGDRALEYSVCGATFVMSE